MADLALIFVMAIWGGSFSILRVFLRSDQDPASAVSPLMFLALRMAVAAALLALFMLGRSAVGPKREPRRRSEPGDLRALLRDGILCGVLLGGGFLLQTEGIQRTTASRSGFFTGLLVVFVPILEFLLFKKRPLLPAIVALGLAFCGMALLAGRFDSGGTTLGDLLTVGCALVFAGHILALGRAAPKHPILGLLLCQLICVGLMAGVVGPLIEPTHVPLEPKLWLGIAYLSILATLLAFGVQTWAQQKISPVRIALLSSLEPVFAAGFAALLIGERLSSRELSGGALIVAGVLIGEVGTAWLASRKIRAEQG